MFVLRDYNGKVVCVKDSAESAMYALFRISRCGEFEVSEREIGFCRYEYDLWTKPLEESSWKYSMRFPEGPFPTEAALFAAAIKHQWCDLIVESIDHVSM